MKQTNRPTDEIDEYIARRNQNRRQWTTKQNTQKLGPRQRPKRTGARPDTSGPQTTPARTAQTGKPTKGNTPRKATPIMTEETEVEITDLTEELAAELIQLVPETQRNIKPPSVKGLTADMEAGRFRLSQDALVVRINPETREWTSLQNGQHRVQARLQAKTKHPIPVMIMYRPGDDLDDYLVMDRGNPRRLADDLKARGTPNYVSMATLSRLGVIYDQLGYYSSSHRPTIATQMDWWTNANHDLAQQSWLSASAVQRRTNTGFKGILHLVQYIGARDWNETEMLRFYTEVKTGAGADDEPAVLLHQSLSSWALNRRTRTPRNIAYNSIVKALHLWAANEKRKYLRWVPKPEPQSLPIIAPWMLNLKDDQAA